MPEGGDDLKQREFAVYYSNDEDDDNESIAKWCSEVNLQRSNVSLHNKKKHFVGIFRAQVSSDTGGDADGIPLSQLHRTLCVRMQNDLIGGLAFSVSGFTVHRIITLFSVDEHLLELLTRSLSGLVIGFGVVLHHVIPNLRRVSVP